jgi:hypothetical protein
MTKALPYLRLATVFSLLLSMVWQVTDRLAHGVFRPGEYFAYFTIHTSMIAAVVLTVTAIRTLQAKPDTKTLTLARLSVSTYAIVVSVVYNALLRGTPPATADMGYSYPVPPDEILHVWGPIFIVLDFALTSTSTKLKFKQIFWVLLFPLAWLIFTILRGLATNWWAYWFLNPNLDAGVGGVITFVLIIVGFMLFSATSSLALNRLGTKATKR